MTNAIVNSSQELETWLDEFMAEQMEKSHIPGVTFSLVQNGELFFAKGYGYADLEQQIPVLADRTLFRVGSISKLFTATAIMQLVEQGLLNLDDDVNKYLSDFQLENNYSQPITIANLLTHTAGFDERLIGISTLEASGIMPLGKYLGSRMPARVLPPGKVMSYSNHGYGLAGYLVELVSGIPFSQYIEEKILKPLTMNHSSFDLPSHLERELSLSYRYRRKQKTYQALPFQHIHIPPAGALNATATDMAKFAIAHLEYGEFESQRILAATTARQMQQQQFTQDPRLPGMGWGFMERRYNQERAIAHGGGISGFASLLYLLPDHNLGFFISSNGMSGISGKFIEEFFKRYFPVPKNTVSRSPSPENRPSLKRYQASYRNNRYARKTLEKVLLLFSPSFRLKAEADGTLIIPKTIGSSNSVYLEVEPLLLQKIDRDNCLVAKEDDNGKITELLTSNGVLEKLPWYETNTFHWIMMGVFIVVFLSGSIVSSLAWTGFFGDLVDQWLQLLAGLTCTLNLVFILGMLLVNLLSRIDKWLQFTYGMPKIAIFLLCIPIVTSILAVSLPFLAILVWMNNEWSLLLQIHYSLVSLTALGFIPFLNYWNLLGFRY
ncbi:MAG: serine hydrolase domain-containing protein [Cyanobacteria bacterium P01_F01_bin.143]